MISRRQIISGSASLIFAIFSLNESVLGADDRSGPFFSIPQGTLPWQPIKVEKSPFFTDQSTLSHCHIETNFSTLYPILVTFGPETPKFTLLTIASFAAIRQKSACHVKYLRIFWTYVDLLYRFGRFIGGDNYPNVRLAVAQRTLLWQPGKFRGWSQTLSGTTITSRFSIRQQIGRS